MVVESEEHYFALLLHPASKAEKQEWLKRKNLIPYQVDFFNKHHWMAIVDDEVCPVLEAFLTLEQRNDK